MKKIYGLGLLIMSLCGCKYVETFRTASVLNSEFDERHNVRHLGRKETYIFCEEPLRKKKLLIRRTLVLLGFKNIQQSDGKFLARRKFYPAIFCGIGGETISVTIKNNMITVVSFKTFPYPAATKFFNEDFEDIMSNLK